MRGNEAWEALLLRGAVLNGTESFSDVQSMELIQVKV